MSTTAEPATPRLKRTSESVSGYLLQHPLFCQPLLRALSAPKVNSCWTPENLLFNPTGMRSVRMFPDPETLAPRVSTVHWLFFIPGELPIAPWLTVELSSLRRLSVFVEA